MSGHTPGPWVVDDGDGQYCGIFAYDGGLALAYLVEPDRACGDVILLPERDSEEQTNREHQANAALIAAAPEMLAMLKRCEEMVSKQNAGPPNWDLMREIIAKAEGLTP